MSELLNVATVAAILKCSPDTVVRRFGKMKGVVNLGSEETRNKRPYRVLRIPKHVVEKFIGHPIDIPKLEPRARKEKDWKGEAAQALARTVIANADSPRDRELFKELQEHARMLTFVEQEEWAELTFIARGECEERDGDE